MAEAMSEGRLAAIREMNRIKHVNAEAAKALLPLQIGELLAEVERLRDERDELARVAMQRGEQAAKWSAKLDEVGETCQEWAADGPAGWMQWPVPEESEAYARRIVDDATRVGLNATLKRRLAGEWREVPHA